MFRSCFCAAALLATAHTTSVDNGNGNTSTFFVKFATTKVRFQSSSAGSFIHSFIQQAGRQALDLVGAWKVSLRLRCACIKTVTTLDHAPASVRTPTTKRGMCCSKRGGCGPPTVQTGCVPWLKTGFLMKALVYFGVCVGLSCSLESTETQIT